MPKIAHIESGTRLDGRVIAYVDGLNLHHGLVAEGLRSHLWIDPCALVRALIKPGQRLERVNYFTSRLSGARAHDSPTIGPIRDRDRRCQATYLEAMVTWERLELHYGHFLEKVRRCRKCGTSWVIAEEKKTDVLIASRMLMDAADRACDQVMLISGDSDLVPPLHIIRDRFSATRIVVAFPPGRRSIDLQRVAHAYLQIGVANIRRSQLPDVVVTPGGVRLERPAEWL
jgi:uncharacterized LabA/DUF88 family protein